MLSKQQIDILDKNMKITPRLTKTGTFQSNLVKMRAFPLNSLLLHRSMLHLLMVLIVSANPVARLYGTFSMS